MTVATQVLNPDVISPDDKNVGLVRNFFYFAGPDLVSYSNSEDSDDLG
jgi:hypothetical protein